MRAVMVMVVAACGSSNNSKPSASDPPEVPRLMPVIPPPDAPPDAPIDAPSAPTCLVAASEIRSVFARGEDVIACFEDSTDARSCWAIARDNTMRGLLAADAPPPPTSSRTVEGFETGPFELIAPDGWTVAPIGDESWIKQLEICDPAKVCTRLTLAKARKQELNAMLSTVAIAPDGKTAVIDRGPSDMGASQLELHSLVTRKLVRTLKVPKWDCANVLDFVDDQILVSGFDCAEQGGSYGVFTPQGKLTANIWSSADQTFDLGSAYGPLGDGRWVFGDGSGFAVWDLRKGKRLAKVALTDRDMIPQIAPQGDHVVEVTSDGTITRYDAKLAVVSTAKIAACP